MKLENLLNQKVIVIVLVDDKNLSHIYGIVEGVEGTLIHLSHVWCYNGSSRKRGPMSINTNSFAFQSVEVVANWGNQLKSPWKC